MNRSIFQIWQSIVYILLSSVNFIVKNLQKTLKNIKNISLINFIIILLILIFFKNISIFCDTRFLHILNVNSIERLVTEKVTIAQAARSHTNFINFWSPRNILNFNFEIINFLQPSGVRFHKKHPLNHPFIFIFNDISEQLKWVLQITHTTPSNFSSNFEFLSKRDLFDNDKLQFIWNKCGLIHNGDVVESSKILAPTHINTNFKNLLIQNKIESELNPPIFNLLKNK